MIIDINEDITKEVTNKIIIALNSLKKGEKLFIYLSSDGGSVEVAEAIIDIVNNNSDIIEIVGYGQLISAAFNLFFRVQCYKTLLHGTFGMCHSSYTSININESGNPNTMEDSISKKFIKVQRDYTISFCRNLGMTDKEINAIKRGKDVYFQYDRMQELLRQQTKNINK